MMKQYSKIPQIEFSSEIKQNRVHTMLEMFSNAIDRYNAIDGHFEDVPEIFIEAGVWEGDISIVFSYFFKNVHSIEIDKILCDKFKNRCEKYEVNNVCIHNNNVVDALPNILKDINTPVAFWLDAHYSGPGTGGEYNSLPIINELNIIKEWGGKCIVIIDDVNKFGTKGDQPDFPATSYKSHFYDWTSIKEKDLYTNFSDYFDEVYSADIKRRVFIKK